MPHVHKLSQIRRSLDASKQLFRCIDKQHLKLNEAPRSCREFSAVGTIFCKIALNFCEQCQQTSVMFAAEQRWLFQSIRFACTAHRTAQGPSEDTGILPPALSPAARESLSRQQTNDSVLVVQDLVFGASFTDHMFLVEHIDGQGWGQPVIKPFGNIPMHPAAQALHYGVCCFEGMKGYLGNDGKARLFRFDCCFHAMCKSQVLAAAVVLHGCAQATASKQQQTCIQLS